MRPAGNQVSLWQICWQFSINLNASVQVAWSVWPLKFGFNEKPCSTVYSSRSYTLSSEASDSNVHVPFNLRLTVEESMLKCKLVSQHFMLLTTSLGWLRETAWPLDCQPQKCLTVWLHLDPGRSCGHGAYGSNPPLLVKLTCCSVMWLLGNVRTSSVMPLRMLELSARSKCDQVSSVNRSSSSVCKLPIRSARGMCSKEL